MQSDQSRNTRRRESGGQYWVRNESAQALVEFIIIFPVVMALVWHLVKVNFAINTSIVNQKHARSHVFLKLLNHRDGPVEEEYRSFPSVRSVFWLGVAAIPIVSDQSQPAPIVELGVGLKPRPIPGVRNERGEPGEEDRRQAVRIRTAFGVCTSRKPGADGSLGDFCGEVSR